MFLLDLVGEDVDLSFFLKSGVLNFYSAVDLSGGEVEAVPKRKRSRRDGKRGRARRWVIMILIL